MTEWTALFGLFSSAFLSATLLPGNSELALLAFLYYMPTWAVAAVIVATVGNTLGGMTSYVAGRFFAHKVTRPIPPLLQRYGVWALLLAWVPVIGDALCVASGVLSHSVWKATLALAIGKGARYLSIAWIFL
ncbi:MAG: DedA family protein [Betaproteobacteria bacterium]|nr:DedA family protein [Betaproteobacteria bacterium]